MLHEYMSGSAKLRITFPQDKFGLDKGKDGIEKPFKDVCFTGGYFQTEDEAEVARLLTVARGNGVFFKKPVVDSAAPTAATPKDGLTDKDRKDLVLLNGYSESLTDKQRQPAIAVLKTVVARFSVQGIAIPEKTNRVKKIKGVCGLALETLIELEIIKESDYERQGNS